jgi:hypothetical protein
VFSCTGGLVLFQPVCSLPVKSTDNFLICTLPT